ncbi:hypothetical protein M0802_001953 [Mischocyttarus mexicanus]|nr:hypothetical protein M0802_001953 [Mischocyttarus mexicanus]
MAPNDLWINEDEDEDEDEEVEEEEEVEEDDGLAGTFMIFLEERDYDREFETSTCIPIVEKRSTYLRVAELTTTTATTTTTTAISVVYT